MRERLDSIPLREVSLSRGEMPILQRIPLTSNLGFRLFKAEDGLLGLRINNSSGTVSAMTTTVAISTETWYHLALSSDGARIFLFVNGNLAGQLTLPRGGPTSSWWGPLIRRHKDTTGFFEA